MKNNKAPLKPFNDFLNTQFEKFTFGNDTPSTSHATHFDHAIKVWDQTYDHYKIERNGRFDFSTENINSLVFRLILDQEYGIDWKDENAVRDLLTELMDKRIPACSHKTINLYKAMLIALVDYYTTRRSSFNDACRYIQDTYSIKRVKQNYYDYKKNDVLFNVSKNIKKEADKKTDVEKEKYYLSFAKSYAI
tara:strand:- start:1235 stop:1810 length:576 start_codon:yes stop_codon:yes gene_type:complete